MDPISDMLTKIKNAGAVHKNSEYSFSNIKYQLAKILVKEGFVGDIKKKPPSALLPSRKNCYKIEL